ncbi:MAG: hypothetical protein ACOX42_03070 [Clostridia bacterium]|jgi:hypothetical protein|nr:hypothetical protein [Clostridiales bacterium]
MFASNEMDGIVTYRETEAAMFFMFEELSAEFGRVFQDREKLIKAPILTGAFLYIDEFTGQKRGNINNSGIFLAGVAKRGIDMPEAL